MRAIGLTPLDPPSTDASRIESMRKLWNAAALAAVETREIRGTTHICRFRGLLGHEPDGIEHRTDGRGNGA